MSADKPQPIDRALVDEFALAAHRDLEAVRQLLDQEPALGAAAHVGRIEIALCLLDRGALV